MKQKILTMILLAGLTVSMLAGCGQTETASTEDTQTAESTTQPEETEQVEEVVTETTEPEVASLEEPEPSIAPQTELTEEPKPEYTYIELNKTMYASSAVNLRDLPSTDGAKVGGLNRAEEVTVLAQCNETQWYKISYNGSEVFVSNSYLVDEKPAEEVAQQTSSPSSNSGGMSRNASDYRSISDLSELSQGAGWDADFAGFCANYQNIEKVAYTYNGTTVLLYDYVWDAGYGTQFIFYDFTRTSTPWYRQHLSELHSIIDAGGASSSSGFHSVSNWQVY